MGGGVADEQFDPQPLKPTPAPEPRMWNLGDVLLITMMFLIPVFVLGIFLGSHPLAMLAVQGVSYAVSLLCARVIISLKTGKGFFESIDWNYPGPLRLPQLLLLGLALSVIVSFFSSALLPIPKNLPVEKLFQTRLLAIVSMSFATIVAPFVEELYFRGIFYGAVRSSLEEERTRNALGALLLVGSLVFFYLAWRGAGSGFALFAPLLLAMGLLLFPFRADRAPLLDGERQTLIAIVLTAGFFAFVHGAQLAHSWGPLLAVLIVGLVLTMVRVRLNSVAASWLVHTAYNGTIFLISWANTSGFRKLN
jgi:uncharacterized protein